MRKWYGGKIMTRLSRRRAIAALSGAAFLEATGVLHAGTGGRVLVCLRLADAMDGIGLVQEGGPAGLIPIESFQTQEKYGMDPALAALQPLFVSRALAVIQEPAGPAARDYVKGGFSAPDWMIRGVGATVLESQGHAFGFRSGLLMLNKYLPIAKPEQQLDNEALLAASRKGNFLFPNTGVGRQLRQVAGILASGAAASEVMFVVSIGGAVAVGDLGWQRSARLVQMSQALAVFHAVTEQLRLASHVTTFTDVDETVPSAMTRTRLVLGGGVIGGEVYKMTDGTEASDILAEWMGMAARNPRYSKPGVAQPRFLF
jgi:hypothetical protein